MVPSNTLRDPTAHPLSVLGPFASADTQTVPLSPTSQSLETMSLFSVPVSLLMFHRYVDLQHMSDPRVSDII